MNKKTIIYAAAAALIGTVIGAGMRAGAHQATVLTTPVTTGPVLRAASQAGTAARPSPARIGASIDLEGSGGGHATITVVKVADPARSTDEYEQPDQGKRLVAVQVRITDTGTTVYDDAPDNSGRLIDSQGQQYEPELFGDTTAGKGFGGIVRIVPGASALGVIVFAVPDGTRITAFQFALDSGFARQSGQWQLNG